MASRATSQNAIHVQNNISSSWCSPLPHIGTSLASCFTIYQTRFAHGDGIGWLLGKCSIWCLLSVSGTDIWRDRLLRFLISDQAPGAFGSPIGRTISQCDATVGTPHHQTLRNATSPPSQLLLVLYYEHSLQDGHSATRAAQAARA